MQSVNIGIMGFGVVGAGVYKILTEEAEHIAHRDHIRVAVKRVLIKNFETEPNLDIAPRELFTLRPQDIFEDSEISVVVECMGGTEPARSFILAALEAGKTVVTSNKEVIAKHWPELEQAAKWGGGGLYIEATVGGGIPILRTVLESMQANRISAVMGIINGTTNYILTQMSEHGSDYAQALKEAQSLGYAEADPAADVEGYDAMYKLSILASMAFHSRIPIDFIFREGITNVSQMDIQVAKSLGYCIKLLAIGKKSDEQVEVRVHPTMLPLSHPLASVSGVFNAIFMHGNAVDDVMLYGRGAGQMPTASAVVSDVIHACHAGTHRYMTFSNLPTISDKLTIVRDWECEFYIRLTASDRPGVLAKVAGAFGNHQVSLASVVQYPAQDNHASIVFVTHKAKERALQAAIDEMVTEGIVHSVDSIIRVEH